MVGVDLIGYFGRLVEVPGSADRAGKGHIGRAEGNCTALVLDVELDRVQTLVFQADVLSKLAR